MLRPLCHFLLIGLALFAVERAIRAGDPAGATAFGDGAAPSDEELLFRAALDAGVAESDVVVQRRLIRNVRFLGLAEEDPAESLEAAFSLGLHRTDPVVRRRLVQQTLAAVRAEARAAEAPEAELRRRYEADPERFVVEARARISHVFIRHGEAGEPLVRAERIRDEISGLDAGAAVLRGDPFLGGHHPGSRSRAEIERLLGAGVAALAFETPVGTWSRPVPSVYGLHLLYVHEIVAEQRLPFAAARETLLEEWYSAREAEHVRALLAELRAR